MVRIIIRATFAVRRFYGNCCGGSAVNTNSVDFFFYFRCTVRTIRLFYNFNDSAKGEWMSRNNCSGLFQDVVSTKLWQWWTHTEPMLAHGQVLRSGETENGFCG